MMEEMAAENVDLQIVRDVLRKHLQGYAARVYFFGSRAVGDPRRDSDIDIAIQPLTPIPPEVFALLRAALEESDVLYRVDVIDLAEADESLRARIVQEGILWNEFGNV